MSRAAVALAACAVGVCAVGLGGTGCRGSQPAGLPDGPASAPSSSAADTRPAGVDVTPPPDDSHAAAPDVNPERTVSPASGPVRFTIRAGRPRDRAAAAVYDAYLGWVRAYLAAFARPGVDDGMLARYATPAAGRAVRARAGALAVRGWAEYGAATVVSAVVRPAAATATVVSCLDLSGLSTRDAAGRLAGRERPVRSAATLTVSTGRWLVSADTKTAVSRCP